MIFQIVKTFGESIGAMLSGGLAVELEAPLTIEDQKFKAGDVVSLSLEEMIKVPEGRKVLLRRLLDGFSKMDGDDLDDLVCDLLVASPPVLHQITPEGAAMPILTVESLDEVVEGPMELIALARASLTMSALPTLADDRTGGESSADETSQKPADT